MKKTIKIIAINIAVFVSLLIFLEMVLRMAGKESIHEMEKKTPGWESNYRQSCARLLTQKVEFINSFYTDSEGLFKANPEYFSKKNFARIAINRDGFRGNPFEYVKTSRPKLLLIGDSFTWGVLAKPLSNSFADLLQQAGYHVYNGGIPGTDPQQYAMIAKKYIPLLHPDAVAICLYLGNDVSGRPVRIQPNRNLHYVTNFGYFLGHDDRGNFFKDAREAFRYFKNRKCGYCTDPWNYFLFKTVVGRGLYQFMQGRQYLRYDPARQWVKTALAEIRDACRAHHSELMIFLIPFVNQDVQKEKSIIKNLHLFEGFPYYYPKDFGKDDYQAPPGKHFNNQGHRRFADFILDVLKKKGFAKEIER
jgi:lysophospholipase L1-like esterase